MEALFSVRPNFIAAELNESISCELRHKMRTYSDVVYDDGDRVCYCKKNFKAWKGLVVVLLKDKLYWYAKEELIMLIIYVN